MKLIKSIKNIYFKYNFINFCKNNFIQENSSRKKNYILVELNSFYPSTLAIPYLAKVLTKKHNAKLLGYFPMNYLSLRYYLFSFLKKIIPFSIYYIYRSFGVIDFLNFKFNKKIKKKN
jgi:hypothetical protein